jgi:pectinesterase
MLVPKTILYAFIALLSCKTAGAQAKKITVALTGAADFRSIQQAINSLPDSAEKPSVIYIKSGVYHEKVFIAKHNIILEGEDRDKTIITQDIARDEWRCAHKDDWGVATLNLNGNDITLKNLTIANDYGFNHPDPREITCTIDTTASKKTITKTGHQMALRSMRATRLKAINCHFRAYAGDTVSPWNLDGGMFYFKDCLMEGGVDFYCPRGWAYAENCRFYTNTGPAAIWHDGSSNPDYKTVLKNCSFDGYTGFNLGRYHKDAQFFLIGCRFSRNMSDTDIYLVPTNNKLQWGKRVYYYACKRDGGNYSWFANNLSEAKGKPDPKNITANWVFRSWDPEKNM